MTAAGHKPMALMFSISLKPDGHEKDTLRNVRRLYGDRPVPALVLMSGQSQSALAGRTDREQELLDGFLVKPLET